MTTIPARISGELAGPVHDAAGSTAGDDAVQGHAPISNPRLRLCYESAAYWSRELPRYACRQQNKADAWAIAAGVVAAVTGLAVFPTADSGGTLQIIAVSLAGLLAAVFALVPRVKNYAEMAGKAREIVTAYGPLEGDLLDALTEAMEGRGSDATRRSLIEAFQTTRAKKDELRYLPVRQQDGTRV